jgi:hypothetical protein
MPLCGTSFVVLAKARPYKGWGWFKSRADTGLDKLDPRGTPKRADTQVCPYDQQRKVKFATAPRKSVVLPPRPATSAHSTRTYSSLSIQNGVVMVSTILCSSTALAVAALSIHERSSPRSMKILLPESNVS